MDGFVLVLLSRPVFDVLWLIRFEDTHLGYWLIQRLSLRR